MGYHVSSEGMKRGFWKVIDERGITQRTFESKEAAISYAEKLNSGDTEHVSGYTYGMPNGQIYNGL